MSASTFPTAAYDAHLKALDGVSDDDRLNYVLSLGRTLSADARNHAIAAGEEMPGCQARVWIAGRLTPNGDVSFAGASEATIVQGLVRIMTESFNGLSLAALQA